MSAGGRISLPFQPYDGCRAFAAARHPPPCRPAPRACGVPARAHPPSETTSPRGGSSWPRESGPLGLLL